MLANDGLTANSIRASAASSRRAAVSSLPSCPEEDAAGVTGVDGSSDDSFSAATPGPRGWQHGLQDSCCQNLVNPVVWPTMLKVACHSSHGVSLRRRKPCIAFSLLVLALGTWLCFSYRSVWQGPHISPQTSASFNRLGHQTSPILATDHMDVAAHIQPAQGVLATALAADDWLKLQTAQLPKTGASAPSASGTASEEQHKDAHRTSAAPAPVRRPGTPTLAQVVWDRLVQAGPDSVAIVRELLAGMTLDEILRLEEAPFDPPVTDAPVPQDLRDRLAVTHFAEPREQLYVASNAASDSSADNDNDDSSNKFADDGHDNSSNGDTSSRAAATSEGANGGDSADKHVSGGSMAVDSANFTPPGAVASALPAVAPASNSKTSTLSITATPASSPTHPSVASRAADLASRLAFSSMAVAAGAANAMAAAGKAAVHAADGAATALGVLSHAAKEAQRTAVVVAGVHEEPAPFEFPVWWFAPLWSGTGYSSEANNFVISMLRSKLMRPEDLWVSHHGDHVRTEVVNSMAAEDRRDLRSMEAGALANQTRPAVVLCHSLPTNWMLPEPIGWAGAECPPNPSETGYVYLIGRTMFETDRLPPVFVPRCNAMNEIWVPSQFSKDVFIASGVSPEKLVIVPEGVNTTWFDPALYAPIDLPTGDLVFGKEHAQHQQPGPFRRIDGVHLKTAIDDIRYQGGKAGKGSGSVASTGAEGKAIDKPFRFLSTFKWEPRKGWDVLLEAYLTEFTAADNVELYVITKPFVGGTNFKQYMITWAQRAMQRHGAAVVDISALPRVYVIHQHISDGDLPRYFKAADAFVLPSRGEGWGRPHVEAMSMGLPIIATNWSGITAYLDDSVGYPLRVDSLVTVSDNSVWWFKGLKWAQPSVSHLKQLMRHVYNHRDEARAKGILARRRMVEQFSPEVLAQTVVKELRRIDKLIPRFAAHRLP